MLTKTNFSVDPAVLNTTMLNLAGGELPTVLNTPTGNFFYDPWVIKDECKGTIWETLLNALPVEYGEARVLVLKPGENYQCHSDIDDRYHLNICGANSFLISFRSTTMYPLVADGVWYTMNAGEIHSAANFGRVPRIQLVVRHLLKNNSLVNPVSVVIQPNGTDLDYARYMFDNNISNWLNDANKQGVINNFSHKPAEVKFNIEADRLDTLKQRVPTTHFKIICQ